MLGIAGASPFRSQCTSKAAAPAAAVGSLLEDEARSLPSISSLSRVDPLLLQAPARQPAASGSQDGCSNHTAAIRSVHIGT